MIDGDGHRDRQANRQTDRKTNRLADRHIERYTKIQKGRQADRVRR